MLIDQMGEVGLEDKKRNRNDSYVFVFIIFKFRSWISAVKRKLQAQL